MVQQLDDDGYRNQQPKRRINFEAAADQKVFGGYTSEFPMLFKEQS